MPEQPFDFFKDLGEQQQNDFLREYLIDTTHYLQPVPFPNSPGYFYYYGEFTDDAYHGNSAANLASLLMLLISRDYLLPIRLKSDTPNNNLYFVFVHDVKELNDPDFTSFEYIQRDELNELAKTLAN
jgi:hypothetical protein